MREGKKKKKKNNNNKSQLLVGHLLGLGSSSDVIGNFELKIGGIYGAKLKKHYIRMWHPQDTRQSGMVGGLL